MNITKVIFGLNAVREAIQDPSRIQKVFIENGASSPASQKLKEEVMRSGVSYSFVPEQKLHKHTKENHQGFVALIGEIQFESLENIIDINKQQLPNIVGDSVGVGGNRVFSAQSVARKNGGGLLAIGSALNANHSPLSPAFAVPRCFRPFSR